MSTSQMSAMAQGVGTYPLSERIIAFGGFLRERGYAVGLSEEAEMLRVADTVGLLDRQRLKLAWRVLVCGSASDWNRYDPLYDRFWQPRERAGRGTVRVIGAAPPRTRNLAEVIAGGEAGEQAGRQAAPSDVGTGVEGATSEAPITTGGASRSTARTLMDFRHFALAEASGLDELAERLARRMRRRLLRRRELARTGRQLDWRRTVRASLRFGGEPIDLRRRRRKKVLPRLVLVIDASRSMQAYVYFFLRFARGLATAFRDAEVFVFHTHLVPATDLLRERASDRLREKLDILGQSFSGGTRIASSLIELNRKFKVMRTGRRPLLVILSDGFDTDEPEELVGALKALRARARRVVWLNPLKGQAGYQPVARGMQAALPYIDLFAPAHNLASLLALESALTRL
jgi:uncharacterized protein with von Willebrand factor type A (vWA) domain